MSIANRASAIDTSSAVDAAAASESFASATGAQRTAEFVNPMDYEDYWRSHFYGTLYYASGCIWKDYRPAYCLGYDAFFANRDRVFQEVESEIAGRWEDVKNNSQLTWNQAKHAVRDGWQFVESAVSDPARDSSIR